mgnify:CR=1 FL=1
MIVNSIILAERLKFYVLMKFVGKEVYSSSLDDEDEDEDVPEFS